MGSLHKNIQLMLVLLKAPILVLQFIYYTIYADDTTLYSMCDQASDLRQQLELAAEVVSDLRDTVAWFDLTLWNAVIKAFATDLSFSNLKLGVEIFTPIFPNNRATHLS